MMKTITLLMAIGLCQDLAFAGGEYWWQNQQGVFGDSDVQPQQQQHQYPDPTTPYPAPPANQFQRPQNQNQGQFVQQSQPQIAQQSQPQIQQVACPVVGALPPVEECKGKASNCWSVGQLDTDCPNNGLCCFDGCANTCLNGPPAPLVQTQPQPQPSNQIQVQQPQNNYQPVTAPRPKPQKQKPRPKPQKVKPWPKPQQQQRPRPQQQKRPRPQQQQRPVFQQQQRPVPQQQRPQIPADAKPYVSCPSAMLCIPRQNCDFNGVITDQTLNLTPQLEMLRVPLIPCINPQNQNVDVCCRDPNYKDPWPNMMMKNKKW